MRIDTIIVRYCVAGLLVLLIDYALLNVLLIIGVGLLEAASISFLAGAITGYLLHSRWTFKYNTGGNHALKFSQFLITGTIGLVTTDIIVYICTRLFLFNHNISKTIAVAVSAAWAYSASRWWIFKKTAKNEATPLRKNKHILVLSPYYLPHIGGLESHAHEFNEHIVRKGWSVTVWTAKIPQTALTKEAYGNNLGIYRYDALEIIAGFPIPSVWKISFWKQWSKIHTSNTYSHVLSRTRFFPSSVLAHIIARYMGIPHIHVEHGSYFVSQKSAFINTIAYVYDITLGRFVLQYADILVANSEATSLFVSQLTNSKAKAHVIYRGIQHSDIAAATAALDIKQQHPKKIIICYTGRLISGKGVHDLIFAIAKCKLKEHISCWIIGDGPARRSLEAKVSAIGLRGVVRFFGARDRKETISLMKASDIVVNPSYTEGLPTAIIEGALSGKAIIATNVGGTCEIVTNGISAILLQPKDTSALASAIDTFVQNPDMRIIFGKAAQTEVAAKFQWKNAIAQYEKILIYPENR